MALGEKIVRELEMTDGTDTLGKWMAHHLASLINAAKCSDDPQSTACKDAVDLILKLWANRNLLPGTADPMCKLRGAIDILDRVGSDSSPFRYYGEIEHERELAGLFDGLCKVFVFGVLLVSKHYDISEYTFETIEYLSEEERRFVDHINGWVHILEQRLPSSPGQKVAIVDNEEKKIQSPENLDSLNPKEKLQMQFSRDIDEMIRNLQKFKDEIDSSLNLNS